MATKTDIHKDFHGALSYGLQYLCDNYGEEEMVGYLTRLAQTAYRPLSESLKLRGLPALEEHLGYIYALEDGEFELGYQDDALVLRVEKCPAIGHMKQHNYPIADKYCEHCRIINHEICKAAGHACSTEYDQEKGSCTQTFRKEK